LHFCSQLRSCYRHTSYPYWGFLWFSPVLPGKCWDSNSN
jgi:hypothetical protein